MLTRAACLLCLAASLPVPALAKDEGPSVPDLLAKAGEYVERYATEFSGLTAEEKYLQKLFRHKNMQSLKVRELRSDMVFVKLEGDLQWHTFRDVYEVDGKPVRERDARLETLFVKARDVAYGRAQEILEESARYNVGTFVRNFNTPTMVITFLHPGNQERFKWKRKGKDTIEGTVGWELEYQEKQSPAFIRDARGTDLFTKGKVWIAEDGRILRTNMSLKDAAGNFQVEITNAFTPWREGGIWVPREMREMGTYLPPAVDRVPSMRGGAINSSAAATNIGIEGEYLDSVATYSAYRPIGAK
jgi:hypothetical protein